MSNNEKAYRMHFAKIYPMLIAKAEKKGRTKDDVNAVTGWLTGYTPAQLDALADSDITYGDFFRNAPRMNANRHLITGVVCGVRVEQVTEPLMQDIRYLDKLVDELAKGKGLDQILRGG